MPLSAHCLVTIHSIAGDKHVANGFTEIGKKLQLVGGFFNQHPAGRKRVDIGVDIRR